MSNPRTPWWVFWLAVALIIVSMVLYSTGATRGGVIVEEQNLPVREGWQCLSLPDHLDSRYLHVIFRGAPEGFKVWQWNEADQRWGAMNGVTLQGWIRTDEWVPLGRGLMVWSPERLDFPQRGLFLLEWQSEEPVHVDTPSVEVEW